MEVYAIDFSNSQLMVIVLVKVEFIWLKKDNCYIHYYHYIWMFPYTVYSLWYSLLFYSHTVILLLQLLISYSNENFSMKLICDDRFIEQLQVL